MFGRGFDNKLYEFETVTIQYKQDRLVGYACYKGYTDHDAKTETFCFGYLSTDGTTRWKSENNVAASDNCEDYGKISETKTSPVSVCKWHVIPVAPNYFCILNQHV